MGHIDRAITHAKQTNAEAVLIELNTPGETAQISAQNPSKTLRSGQKVPSIWPQFVQSAPIRGRQRGALRARPEGGTASIWAKLGQIERGKIKFRGAFEAKFGEKCAFRGPNCRPYSADYFSLMDLSHATARSTTIPGRDRPV